jgi:8-oxo-dGTP pyrophosphatase MutT (NUDIX family)
LKEVSVVTCFLEHRGKILLMRRSDRVGSYRGLWAGVSGYLEGEPDAQAMTEIAEETGLTAADVTLVRRGDMLRVTDAELDTAWTVHPYLFRVESTDQMRIDWEHHEMRWVAPGEIPDYQTVPMLTETWAKVSA